MFVCSLATRELQHLKLLFTPLVSENSNETCVSWVSKPGKMQDLTQMRETSSGCRAHHKTLIFWGHLIAGCLLLVQNLWTPWPERILFGNVQGTLFWEDLLYCCVQGPGLRNLPYLVLHDAVKSHPHLSWKHPRRPVSILNTGRRKWSRQWTLGLLAMTPVAHVHMSLGTANVVSAGQK